MATLKPNISEVAPIGSERSNVACEGRSPNTRTYQRTCQIRVYASRSGYARFEEVLSLTRRLYNAALEHRNGAWKSWAKRVTFNEQSREFTLVGDDDSEYKSISRRISVGALWRLELAYQSFFRRAMNGEKPGFPRFKPASRWRTIEPRGVERWVRHSKSGQAYLAIKGLPILRLKGSSPLLPKGKLVAVRLTKRGRRIIANLSYEVEMPEWAKTGAMVGLDMGIANRITTSDGERIEGVKTDRRKVRRYQRAMARRRQGSVRFRSARALMAREEERVRIRSRNTVHRETTRLIRQYDLVAVEDLPIKSLVRSARGTAEEPGKNVAQKTGLNRRIHEQTWGLIRSQLAYKAEWAGKQLVAVDARFTSQTCSQCGVVDNASRKSQSVFRCRSCGYEQHADVNAAVNILGRAIEHLRGSDAPRGPKPTFMRAAGGNNNHCVGDGARRNPRAEGLVTG